MIKKYIIQIDKDEQYPFGGIKLSSVEYLVRVSYLPINPQQYKIVSRNIQLLLQINSTTLLNITKVRQIRDKGFIVDYQFVPTALRNSPRLGEPLFIAELKCKIYSFFQLLAQTGISFFPTFKQIGINEEGEPKIYVNLWFEVPSLQKNNLLIQYQKWTEQLFTTIYNLKQSGLIRTQSTLLPDYSQSINQKINELEMRISRISTRKLSENLPAKQQKAPKKVNMVLEYLPDKRNRNNSFSQKTAENKAVDRYHRCSVGQQETQSRKLQQQQVKDDCLTKRVSQALVKTQAAFKLFEKFQKKSGFSKSQGKL